jgi:hypothetical protein
VGNKTAVSDRGHNCWSWPVAFRGENGFGIGTGNFAYRDPAESTDKRASCPQPTPQYG